MSDVFRDVALSTRSRETNDQSNPMNPNPRKQAAVKASSPSSSEYHAADQSVWQR